MSSANSKYRIVRDADGWGVWTADMKGFFGGYISKRRAKMAIQRRIAGVPEPRLTLKQLDEIWSREILRGVSS